MVGPIKLEITDDGDVVTSTEFMREKNEDEAKEEASLLEKDPENYIHKCFHGQKCKNVLMKTEPYPAMICKANEKQISLHEGCPKNYWDGTKKKSKEITKVLDWYQRNRRLHYKECAEKWKKRYGSTRKLPDYIADGMRS
jgi:hypothetical protein